MAFLNYNLEMQKCSCVVMLIYKGAKTHKYNSAKIPKYKYAQMQKYNNAKNPKCRNAKVQMYLSTETSD